MSIEQIRTCDVFGIKKDVLPYRITVAVVDSAGVPCGIPAIDCEIDFCGRALERAERFIEKACSKPTQLRVKA